MSIYKTTLQTSVSVYGNPQVGKSTFIARFLEFPFSNFPQTKCDYYHQSICELQNSMVTYSKIIINEQKSNIYLPTDSIVIIFNAYDGYQSQQFDQIIKELTEQQLIFLIINKVDCSSNEQFKQIYVELSKLQKELKQRQIRSYIYPLVLNDLKYCKDELSNSKYLMVQHSKFLQTKRQYDKELQIWNQEQLKADIWFQQRITGSLQKRNIIQMDNSQSFNESEKVQDEVETSKQKEEKQLQQITDDQNKIILENKVDEQ